MSNPNNQWLADWARGRSAENYRIACCGEAMIELSRLSFEDGQASLKIAGDTMNTAVYLKRCTGKTADVAYLTSLGEDKTSDSIIEILESHGLNTDFVGRNPERLPGIYAIELDELGERSFRYWRSQSAAKTMFDETAPSIASLAQFDVIYLSGISLAILPPTVRTKLASALYNLSQAGHLVVFDTNYRPALWTSPDEAAKCFDEIWPSVSIGLPSIDDMDAIYGTNKAADHTPYLVGLGVKELVLRRGEKQPLVWCGDYMDVPTLRAADRIVDTTGAGDSFNGAYVAARLDGLDCVGAVVKSHELALKVIANSGAIIPV